MATTRKLAELNCKDKLSSVGIIVDEPYYYGITCEDTASDDERKFDDYLSSELKLSEVQIHHDESLGNLTKSGSIRLSNRKKNTSEYDEYADDELDELDEQELFDEYYGKDYVAPTIHRKCTKTLLSWDEIPVPDWDTESYLGTCSESEFAFDDTVEQQTIPVTNFDKFDIAPEDDVDLRPRPRGTHTKPKAHIHTQYEDDDEEQGYWELLPGARRFGTI
jgi:hypothetical protein